MKKNTGRSVWRREGLEKIQGRARYIDDLQDGEMLYGATVRSQVARGILRDIKFDPRFDWTGFTVVRAGDIPGENRVASILKDQPFLVEEKINHPGEAILLLAHADKNKLQAALKRIQIIVEELPAVVDLNEAYEVSMHSQDHGDKIFWGNDNILAKFHIQKGDDSFPPAGAASVIEGTYYTGHQEQLYIETQGVIAEFDDARENLAIWGSMQCPYYVQGAMKTLFGLADQNVRVVQQTTGGGFGGKEDYPSVLAGHAALLSYRSGKPVKMIYDRREDLQVTTKRHPSRTHIKTSFDSKGKLLAVQIEFVLDGGAYATLSKVVLSRGALHALGPYFCENVDIKAYALATNSPPNGAFRGFGAPQSIFAIEKHMDIAARRMDIDPVELRRLNFLKDGLTTATGQVIADGVDMDELLDQALAETEFIKKRHRFAEENKSSSLKKGIGLATFFHGGGFTGSGERDMASIVSLEIDQEGFLHIQVSSTEIGQGATTVLTQIVSDALSLPLQLIIVDRPDTSIVPNSGPTVASRTTMVVGKILEDTAFKLKEELEQASLSWDANELWGEKQQKLAKFRKQKRKIFGQYQYPKEMHWDEKTYKGSAYAAYSWGVYVAEISYDSVTGETWVDDFYALQEIGKVVNPVMAEGQVQGGVLQGIGFALFEKAVYKDGRMINNQMSNYIIPTSLDFGDIRVGFFEAGSLYGPQGAKGLGELPLDGSAPAVINALDMVLSNDITFIPFLPEDALKLDKESK